MTAGLAKRMLYWDSIPEDPRKSESVEKCVEGRNVNLFQSGRMDHNRSEWRGFMRDSGWGLSPGNEPYNVEIPQGEII